jgi:hypothetical protein
MIITPMTEKSKIFSLIHLRGADFRQHAPSPSRHSKQIGGVENLMILKQACSSEYQGAQGAFKDSMIH